MKETNDYPDDVLDLHRSATANVPKCVLVKSPFPVSQLPQNSIYFIETLVFARGIENAAESAHILVRELARRDKISLLFTLLHVMRVCFAVKNWFLL